MQLTESARDVASKGLRASIPEVLPALEARALRLTRSRPDAEDLLQETVVRALRFESTFQRGTNLRAWMQQILQSVFISRCRRRVRERRALERFTGDPTLTARMTSAPTLNCVSEKMHAAFVALPERFRGVIELVDLRDHSYREAADILGVPVGTVMSRLFRARRMLKENLGTDEASPADGPRASVTAVRSNGVGRSRAPLRSDAALDVDAASRAVVIDRTEEVVSPKRHEVMRPERRRINEPRRIVPKPRKTESEPPNPARAA